MDAINDKKDTTPPGAAKTKSESSPKTDKMRLEIEELQWKIKWVYRVGQFVSFITVLLAIGAFAVSIYEINSQRRESAQREAAAKEKEATAYEREFRKPVWEKQLALLFETSNAAATIATSSPESEDRKIAEARFRQLFWGPVVLAEKDQELKNEMIKFSNCLDGLGISDECDSEAKKALRLQQLSLALTNKCRLTIGSIWDIRFENLYQREEEQAAKNEPTSLP